MSAGDHQATIKEVARLAGVAASSVSRVLNEHADVSPQMRARVIHAAEQLGYQPDFLAQSLRLGLTRTVGFVVRDIANPLFAGIVKGAEQELENHGYSILLMNSLGDPMLDAKHVGVLRQRRVDGLILSLQSEVNANTRLALRLGHRRVSLIVGNAETRGSRERAKGLRAGFASLGLPVPEEGIVEVASYARDLGYAATLRLLDRPVPPTALIAGNSQLGIGVLAGLSERRVRPGQDMSLVICDDLELLRLMSPPVSVVARDAEKMGVAAARLLLDRLQHVDSQPGQPCQVTLPTHYVGRGSCQPPPAS
jgi:LacI family transcriptional regulator